MSDSKEEAAKAPVEKQKMTGKHIGFLLACCAMEFCCVAAWFNSAGIFYPGVSQEFNVGTGQIGLYMSISFFVTMFVLPPGGRLMEKRSCLAIYAATNIMMAAAFALNAAAPNVWFMYISGVLAGCMGAFDMYMIPVIMARFFKERTGFFVGIAASMSGVGAAVWNIVIAMVIQGAGWRMGYLTLCIVVIVVVLPLTFLFVRSYPEQLGIRAYGEVLDDEEIRPDRTKSTIVHVSGADYAKVAKSPVIVLLVIMAMVAGMAVMMSQYLTSYAISVGYALTIGATMTSLSMIGNMLGKLLFSAAADKSTTLAVICPIVFPIIGFLGLIFLGTVSPYIAIAAAFLYGTIQPSNTSILPLVVQNLFGDKDYGKIWSTISPFSSFACGVGSSIWGFIYDASGTFFVIFIVGIILLLIRLVCYFIALPIAKRIPHTEEDREVVNA